MQYKTYNIFRMSSKLLYILNYLHVNVHLSERCQGQIDLCHDLNVSNIKRLARIAYLSVSIR